VGVGVVSITALGLLLACAGPLSCGSGSDTSTKQGGASAASTTIATTVASTSRIPKSKIPLKAPSRPGIDDTYDEDDAASYRVENHDDAEIEIYGKPATPGEWRATEAFARGYFAAAAAEDGARACPMLTSWLGPTLGGSYEGTLDPVYLHGKTCAEVMTKLFEHRHRLMAKEAKGLEVTDVRVTPHTAFILLAFRGVRERRFMGLERQGANNWKLEALTDSQYP
jgi:hypothetical protein